MAAATEGESPEKKSRVGDEFENWQPKDPDIPKFFKYMQGMNNNLTGRIEGVAQIQSAQHERMVNVEVKLRDVKKEMTNNKSDIANIKKHLAKMENSNSPAPSRMGSSPAQGKGPQLNEGDDPWDPRALGAAARRRSASATSTAAGSGASGDPIFASQEQMQHNFGNPYQQLPHQSGIQQGHPGHLRGAPGAHAGAAPVRLQARQEVRGGGGARQERAMRESFVPQAVYLKGWAVYKKGRGLPSHAAKKLGEEIKEKLLEEAKKLADSVAAPFMSNWQITLKVLTGKEDCWTVRNKLQEIITNENIKVDDTTIFASVKQAPWIKKKNKVVARALHALESLAKDEDKAWIKPGWLENSVYINVSKMAVEDATLANRPDLKILGSLAQIGDWRWKQNEIKNLLPYIDFDALVNITDRGDE